MFWSPLTRRLYATRAWHEVSPGVVACTGERFDVTNDIAGLMEREHIIFTRREDDSDGASGNRETTKHGRRGGRQAALIVDRIERLEGERKAIGGDIRDIYAEAKSAGFDVGVLRELIRIRKQEPADVEEQETLLDTYRRALGM